MDPGYNTRAGGPQNPGVILLAYLKGIGRLGRWGLHTGDKGLVGISRRSRWIGLYQWLSSFHESSSATYLLNVPVHESFQDTKVYSGPSLHQYSTRICFIHHGTT